MPNIKTLKTIGVSEARFRELYYACLQYSEWKEQLSQLDPLRGVGLDGLPKGHNPHGLDDLAIKRAEISKKIDDIDKCALEAGEDIAQAVLKGVTTKGATYQWLANRGYLYAGARKYYEARRRFFKLLDMRWR